MNKKARIIAVTNQKGGVGKTTTAVSLTTGLSKLGYKTLLIDTDPQCNSSDTFRAVIDGEATLYDIMCEGELGINCIQHTEVGDIIPSDKILAEAEQKLPTGPERVYLLREQCQGLEELYDFIIIDTNPGIEVLINNALTYAHEVLVPMVCDRYSLNGLDVLRKKIIMIKKFTNPSLELLGMLLIQYVEREVLCKEIIVGLEPVAGKLETKILNTKIRKAADLRNSQSRRMSIYDFKPNSHASEDYMNLCKELV